MARFNLLGTQNHILSAATVGAAIGWAAVAPAGWRRYLVLLAVYPGVAFVYICEDVGGNVLTTLVAGALRDPW